MAGQCFPRCGTSEYHPASAGVEDGEISAQL
ncbi:hypothetical protein PUG81_17835 [Erwiniaceae bacterium L1_54_6]|nr:hypothetical protein [Erwiniaceae bacterium L1_54_6]